MCYVDNCQKEKEAEYLIDKLEELNREDPDVIKHVFQRKSGLNIEKYNILLDELKEMHKEDNNSSINVYKDVKKKTRGELLEVLIQQLVLDSKVCDLFANVTNDTNEYDVIISPSKAARISYNAFPDIIYQLIICECKNYKGTVGVTWIGKLYSLLSTARLKIGVIFSYYGITGSDKSDAFQLINKIFLKDNIAILSFDINDYEKIKNGESFFDILEKKYYNLKLNAKIDNFKIAHSSEIRVNELMNKIESEKNNIKYKLMTKK